jgi:outer membrane protein assembly factor BamB
LSLRSFLVWGIAVALLSGCRGFPTPVWQQSYQAPEERECWPTRIDGGAWISNETLLTFEKPALVARSPRDGTELWRYDHGPGFCLQALDFAGDDVVVLETRQNAGTWQRDYLVAALDVRDGKLRWRIDLPDDAWTSTLAIGPSSVFVLARPHWSRLEWDPLEATRPDADADESIRLHALDRSDGSTRWSAPVESIDERNPVESAAIALRAGYALVSKNKTDGRWGAELFDASTGARRWGVPFQRLGDGRVLVYGMVSILDDSRLAVIYDRALEHRSIETGERIDSIRPDWDHPYGIAVDGRLYSYDVRGWVEAFSIETGRRLWRHDFGVKRDWKGIDRGERKFFVREDRVSVGVGDGCIYVIDSETGRVRERLDVGHHFSRTPAILSEGLIILDGYVAYEPRRLDCRPWNPF